MFAAVLRAPPSPLAGRLYAQARLFALGDGKLVDRFGPRKMWAVSAAGQAAMFAAWPFITDFWTNQVLLNIVIDSVVAGGGDRRPASATGLPVRDQHRHVHLFLPMREARGVEDVPTVLRAVRVSSSFFVLSCVITLATHDTVGWSRSRWCGSVTSP